MSEVTEDSILSTFYWTSLSTRRTKEPHLTPLPEAPTTLSHDLYARGALGRHPRPRHRPARDTRQNSEAAPSTWPREIEAKVQ